MLYKEITNICLDCYLNHPDINVRKRNGNGGAFFRGFDKRTGRNSKKLFLEKGADVNKKIYIIDATDICGSIWIAKNSQFAY